MLRPFPLKQSGVNVENVTKHIPSAALAITTERLQQIANLTPAKQRELASAVMEELEQVKCLLRFQQNLKITFPKQMEDISNLRTKLDEREAGLITKIEMVPKEIKRLSHRKEALEQQLKLLGKKQRIAAFLKLENEAQELLSQLTPDQLSLLNGPQSKGS